MNIKNYQIEAYFEDKIRTNRLKLQKLKRSSKSLTKLITLFISVELVFVGALITRLFKSSDLTNILTLKGAEGFALIGISVLFFVIVFLTWFLNHVFGRLIDNLEIENEEISKSRPGGRILRILDTCVFFN